MKKVDVKEMKDGRVRITVIERCRTQEMIISYFDAEDIRNELDALLDSKLIK